jgi:hypothetical protein
MAVLNRAKQAPDMGRPGNVLYVFCFFLAACDFISREITTFLAYVGACQPVSSPTNREDATECSVSACFLSR